MGVEGLAALGAGAGVGLRQHAALVAEAVPGLVLETVAGAAGAATLRTPTLDHEIVDHPVEVEAVVEAAPGQVGEIGDRQRRLLGLQLDANRAAVGVEGGDQAHGMLREGDGAVPARHRTAKLNPLPGDPRCKAQSRYTGRLPYRKV